MNTGTRQIMNLLKGLTREQSQRLVQCIHKDEGLLISVGQKKGPMLMSVNSVESILAGKYPQFSKELAENKRFAETLRSMIFRIMAPDDHLMEFFDFRDEAWPEE